jgi:hypothetical protein
MSRIPVAPVACEKTQWHGKEQWLQNKYSKWDDCQKDNVRCRMGSAGFTLEVLAKE